MIKKISLALLLILIMTGLAFFYLAPRKQFLHYPQNTIYRSQTVQIAVPSCPLQANSLIVESIFPEKSLSQWTKRQHAESYHLLENTAQLWKDNEFIDNFMIIATIPPRMHADNFFWEIIPYTKKNYNLFEQLLVLGKLTFDSPCLPKAERQSIKRKYQDYLPFFSKSYRPIPEDNFCPPVDVFCQPEIIAKQLLYEGKHTHLLYNHAPIGIGEEKLHFIIIPKAHRTNFMELTLEEYVEAQEISSKLILYYKQRGYPIVYIFHKSGKYAGQTVPHWHEHLIFAPRRTHEFIGKLIVLQKMLFPTSPLNEKKFKKLVDIYRLQAKEALNSLNERNYTKE